jgi:hypothetical protein
MALWNKKAIEAAKMKSILKYQRTHVSASLATLEVLHVTRAGPSSFL